MRALAFLFVVACGASRPPVVDPSVDLLAKEQVVDARFADVRAAEDRRATVVAEVAGHDDHDLRIEIEGAANRLLRARQRYNAAAAEYDAAVTRASTVIDPRTHRPFAMRPYLPATLEGPTPFVAPKLAGRVTDLAGKLTVAQRRAIEDDLAVFDRGTTNEIAVLVVPSLDGHSIEEAAYVTASTWKLGKRGVDNGVLVLVAVAERRVRIETGRGVETVLTDLRANDIIANMKPSLRAGDYFEAIIGAITAIEKTLRER